MSIFILHEGFIFIFFFFFPLSFFFKKKASPELKKVQRYLRT